MAYLGYSEDFELDDDGILRDSMSCKYIMFLDNLKSFFSYLLLQYFVRIVYSTFVSNFTKVRTRLVKILVLLSNVIVGYENQTVNILVTIIIDN